MSLFQDWVPTAAGVDADQTDDVREAPTDEFGAKDFRWGFCNPQTVILQTKVEDLTGGLILFNTNLLYETHSAL